MFYTRPPYHQFHCYRRVAFLPAIMTNGVKRCDKLNISHKSYWLWQVNSVLFSPFVTLKLCTLFWSAGHTTLLTMQGIHYMTTSWNGNAFCITGPLWGESTDHRRITSQRASNADIRYFLDVRPSKLLIKQSHGRLFETPWRSSDITVMQARNAIGQSSYYWSDESCPFLRVILLYHPPNEIERGILLSPCPSAHMAMLERNPVLFYQPLAP